MGAPKSPQPLHLHKTFSIDFSGWKAGKEAEEEAGVTQSTLQDQGCATTSPQPPLPVLLALDPASLWLQLQELCDSQETSGCCAQCPCAQCLHNGGLHEKLLCYAQPQANTGSLEHKSWDLSKSFVTPRVVMGVVE